MKKVRKFKKVNSANEGSDYSDWYRRDVIDMEDKVKAKLKTMSTSPESNFFPYFLSIKRNLACSYIYSTNKSMKKERQARNITLKF